MPLDETRMTRLSLAAVAILVSVAGARAETLWVGNAFVVAATQQCGRSAAIGDHFRAIFRPAGSDLGNGDISHLALVTVRSSFVLRTATFQQTNYVAQTIGSTLSIGSHSGAILDWQQSSGFSGATPHANVTATFTRFFGVKNCTATLEINFAKLP